MEGPKRCLSRSL